MANLPGTPGSAGTLPEVSVIIPAYGVAPYVGETLASVVAQTATSWEVIVVNDGSPDTPELELAIEGYRDRIRYLVQENRGAAAARNTGIQAATGEWLAFLDGDDKWEPEFLERQLRFLKKRHVDMAWSDGWVIGDTRHAGKRIMELVPCHGPVTVTTLLQQSVVVCTSATIVRRSLVTQVGGFDDELRRAQDFDLWVRLMHSGAKAAYNLEPLIYYRIREGSLTGDALSQATRGIDVLEHLDRKMAFSAADRRLLHSRIAALRAEELTLLGKSQLVARDYSAAAVAFREAYQLMPSAKLLGMAGLLRFAPVLARRLFLARHPDGAHER